MKIGRTAFGLLTLLIFAACSSPAAQAPASPTAISAAPTLTPTVGMPPDFYAQHYHGSERHNGNLYVIRRIGYTPGGGRSTGWTDELWRYDLEGNGTKLYAAQGTVDQLTAHDLEAHTPFFPALTLLKWSDDGRTFWGAVNAGPRPWTIFKIDVGSWQAMAYDLSELSIPWEYDLNADMGMLVYSDCPQMYAADDVEALAKSQRQVSLFIYAPSVCSLSRPRA